MGTREPSLRPSRLEIEVEVTLESDHNFYTGFTQNISAGGLFIATEQLLPVGAQFGVKFALTTSTEPIAVDVDVVVRWVRESEVCGMGVQFVSLPDETAAAINRFLMQRDSIFYDQGDE